MKISILLSHECIYCISVSVLLFGVQWKDNISYRYNIRESLIKFFVLAQFHINFDQARSDSPAFRVALHQAETVKQ